MVRRLMCIILSVLCLAAGYLSGATSVSAHANLVSCNIRNHSVFRLPHVPRRVVAHFAEDLDPAHSWMKVFEAVGDHGLVTQRRHSAVSFKDEKVMTLSLPRLRPLPYYAIWYTRSAQDSHDAAGIVYFTVTKK